MFKIDSIELNRFFVLFLVTMVRKLLCMSMLVLVLRSYELLSIPYVTIYINMPIYLNIPLADTNNFMEAFS